MWGFVLLWTAAAAAGLRGQAASNAAFDPYSGIPDLAPDGEGNEARNNDGGERLLDGNGGPRRHDTVYVEAVDPRLKWRHRLIVQEQLAPAPVPGNSVVQNRSLESRNRPVANSPEDTLDGIAAAVEGRPGRIVRLSPAQLLNETGQYRVSGSDRVRKAPGFEIAYDYYFKPDEHSQRNNFKIRTRKSMPLILATSFLIILVICVAVCAAGICWGRARRLVTTRPMSSATSASAGMPHGNAAGDSNATTFANDKYMI